METLNFKVNPYNIWSYGKQGDTDTTVFGTLPQDIIEQLLYYYTEPFDVIYDPFGGAGITVDACKKWYRRYYVTDKTPTEIALTKNIKKRSLQEGLPDGLPVPKLVFLDPPYWEQAKGRYSNDTDDLGNVTEEEFHNVLVAFFKELKKKMNGGYVAVIMGMTHSGNKVVSDHAIKIYRNLEGLGFKFVQRVNVPYNYNQTSKHAMDDAIKKKYMLHMYRDLMIFKKEQK